jgi:imidazolonepropionase-like amidohydrolase
MSSNSDNDLSLQLTPSDGPRWLRVGRLFTGEDTHVIRDGHLVFDGSTIRYAGREPPPAELLRSGQLAPDLDLPDYTVLPGLIDAHTHLFLEGGELDPARRSLYLKLSATELYERALARLPRLVRIGITGVREAGDKVAVGSRLQARWRSANRGTMPYVDAPGAAINHAGRYGSFMARPTEDDSSVEATVSERIAAGAHRIKLLATGIVNFEKGTVTSKPQMAGPELSQFVAAARAGGRQTMVHCSGNEGVTNCLDAEVDSIEHGFFIDDTQLARLRDLGLAWVPTFAPVRFQLDHPEAIGWSTTVQDHLRRIVDGHSRSLVRAAEMGVRIVAGSDAGSHGVAHGWGFLRELELMEQAGLTASQVLHSATGASAARLDYTENIGRLVAGAKPRFILTAHDVLRTVSHLRKSKAVVFDGRVFTAGDDPSEPGL